MATFRERRKRRLSDSIEPRCSAVRAAVASRQSTVYRPLTSSDPTESAVSLKRLFHSLPLAISSRLYGPTPPRFSRRGAPSGG
ncbi:MAG: hypothetical protein DYH06_04040 [Acidobacteria bacterium ACB2]|nr:hypothetical protein [Acidobacteria bacterium ACB2]